MHVMKKYTGIYAMVWKKLKCTWKGWNSYPLPEI